MYFKPIVVKSLGQTLYPSAIQDEMWTGYVDKVQFWCSFGFGILVPSHVLYTYDQGHGTQGDWGSDFPRIRDLYSKSFENSQIQSYFQCWTPPLGKNHSLAPAYGRVQQNFAKH